MGKMQRNKGKVYEREVANRLQAVYPAARRSYGQSREGHDVPDVIGTTWWVECSHGVRPNILAKYEQALDATKRADAAAAPVLVVTRANRGPDLVTLSLDAFIELVRGQADPLWNDLDDPTNAYAPHADPRKEPVDVPHEYNPWSLGDED